MSGSFKATWLGDGDPQAQIIHMGDLRFIRGEAVTVPADHDEADRIKDNPTFSVGTAKHDPVPVDEPTEDEQQERAEEGTAKAALKRELAAYGVTVKGNPSEDTLRAKLVEASKPK